MEIAILCATLANEAATPGKEMNIDLIHFTSIANGVENRPNRVPHNGDNTSCK